MPLWLWSIVLAGLVYGLVEVAFGERRTAAARRRRMAADAPRRAFTVHRGERHHELTAALLLLPGLGRPGPVGPVFEGLLPHGTPLVVFDFDEEVGGGRRRAGRVGFRLDYPTDWPTLVLSGPTAGPAHEHELSLAVLASPLCDHLAAQGDWSFTFTGGSLIGVSPRYDGRDFVRAWRVAASIDERLPRELVLRWAA